MLLRSLLIVSALSAAATVGVALIAGAPVAAGLGGGLSWAGGVLGLVLIRRGLVRDPNGVKGVFSGFVVAMLVRMALVGIGLAVAVAGLQLPPLPFIAAFFVVYLITQVAEILSVQRANRSGRALAS